MHTVVAYLKSIGFICFDETSKYAMEFTKEIPAHPELTAKFFNNSKLEITLFLEDNQFMIIMNTHAGAIRTCLVYLAIVNSIEDFKEITSRLHLLSHLPEFNKY